MPMLSWTTLGTSRPGSVNVRPLSAGEAAVCPQQPETFWAAVTEAPSGAQDHGSGARPQLPRRVRISRISARVRYSNGLLCAPVDENDQKESGNQKRCDSEPLKPRPGRCIDLKTGTVLENRYGQAQSGQGTQSGQGKTEREHRIYRYSRANG